MKEVSMFDAKTHFSSIIAEVQQQHQGFIVKKRGHKVAKIIPYEILSEKDITELIQAMDMLSQEVGCSDITVEDIRKMRDEGRD